MRLFPIAALALLLGCETAETVLPEIQPKSRPAAPAPVREVPSRPSPELTRYYSLVERNLLEQGLLRTDGGGPDTPFSAQDLIRNFEQIALYEEYATVGGRFVARPTESQIHKWTGPVLIQVTVGAGVPEEIAARDRAAIGRYARRLARVTEHPIRVVEEGGNFDVLILTEGERREAGPLLRRRVPGVSDTAVETVTEMPRQNYCLVFAMDRQGSGVYSQAVAVIRAEHPDLLRLSCIHEEIAQGLGLSNDSPHARPSIFNDDEEFGLLTRQDELLLRILYDPRIEPGMTVREAMPRVREIARDLLPES